MELAASHPGIFDLSLDDVVCRYHDGESAEICAALSDPLVMATFFFSRRRPLTRGVILSFVSHLPRRGRPVCTLRALYLSRLTLRF